VTGIPTGFVDFDKLTCGLQNGEMIVIAARPSIGKTSLALNIAEYVSTDCQLPTAIFSLEMTGASLILRAICARARVNLRNIRDGFMTHGDFPKLTAAAAKIANSKLYIDQSSTMTILELRAKARRLFQQHGIKLFVVDYLQLLHATNQHRRRHDNRQQEMTEVSQGIKALAKELNIPIIALSQLNRELEREAGRRPRLSDLRETGALEQDADVVAFLYKPKQPDDEEESFCEQEAVPINLLVAKQRNGPTGEVPLCFLKSYTRFESVAKATADP